jgi:hypothetical protein
MPPERGRGRDNCPDPSTAFGARHVVRVSRMHDFGRDIIPKSNEACLARPDAVPVELVELRESEVIAVEVCVRRLVRGPA